MAKNDCFSIKNKKSIKVPKYRKNALLFSNYNIYYILYTIYYIGTANNDAVHIPYQNIKYGNEICNVLLINFFFMKVHFF